MAGGAAVGAALESDENSFFGSESRIALTAARMANILSADVGNSGQADSGVVSGGQDNPHQSPSVHRSVFRQVLESAGLRSSNNSSSIRSRISKHSEDHAVKISSSDRSKDSKQSEDRGDRANSTHCVDELMEESLGSGTAFGAAADSVGARGSKQHTRSTSNASSALGVVRGVFTDTRVSFSSATSAATMSMLPSRPYRVDSSSSTLANGMKAIAFTDEELQELLKYQTALKAPSEVSPSEFQRNKREILLLALDEVCRNTHRYFTARLFLPTDRDHLKATEAIEAPQSIECIEVFGAGDVAVQASERELAAQAFQTGLTRAVLVHDVGGRSNATNRDTTGDSMQFATNDRDEKASVFTSHAGSNYALVIYVPLKSSRGKVKGYEEHHGEKVGVLQLFQHTAGNIERITTPDSEYADDRQGVSTNAAVDATCATSGEAIEKDMRTTDETPQHTTATATATAAATARANSGSLIESGDSASEDSSAAGKKSCESCDEDSDALSIARQLTRLVMWLRVVGETGVGIGVGAGSASSEVQFRFLVVDDSSLARKQLRQWLETLFGPHCTSVGELYDGADVARLVAAAAQKNLLFDAVFLDWMLPIIDGPSAAKALRAAGYRGQIVGMSATQAAAKEAFAAAGVEAVLEKPVSQAALLPIVAKILLHKEEDAVEEAVVSVSVRPGCERLEKLVEEENGFLDGSMPQRPKLVGSIITEGSFVDGSISNKSKQADSADVEDSLLDSLIKKNSEEAASADTKDSLLDGPVSDTWGKVASSDPDDDFSDGLLSQNAKVFPLADVESSFKDGSIPHESKNVGATDPVDTCLDGSISHKSKKMESATLSDPNPVPSIEGQKKAAGSAGGKGAGGANELFQFLVVDDVPSVRKVIAHLLTKKGHGVVEAEDGVDALKAYKKSVAGGIPFDCVLMDFVMPHMDGPTATKEMRSLGYKGLVLGVTGNVLPSDVEHFMAHGANRVIPKPLKADMLKKIVEELTRRRTRGNWSKQPVDQPLATVTGGTLDTPSGLNPSPSNSTGSNASGENDASGLNIS